MTHKAHDQFTKQYLAYLLSWLGEAEVSYEVRGRAFQADLKFSPTAALAGNAPPSLGLLRLLAATSCLLEYFWTPPTKREIRTGLVKLYLVHNELYNQARGQKVPPDDVLPHLWILTTSAAETFLTGFHAVPKLLTWGKGIYWFGDSFKTAIVVLNQLPATTDTLWLRLLAKGATRQQALEELLALPEEHPLRGPVLELINNYLTEINRQPLTDDEKEFFMELSPAYLQWREETFQHGKLQGL
jgi:hypothetical protein